MSGHFFYKRKNFPKKYLDSQQRWSIIISFDYLISQANTYPFYDTPVEKIADLLKKLSKYYQIIIIFERAEIAVEKLFPDARITLVGEFGATARIDGKWSALKVPDLNIYLEKLKHEFRNDFNRGVTCLTDRTSICVTCSSIPNPKEIATRIEKVLYPVIPTLNITYLFIDVFFKGNLKDERLLKNCNVFNVLYCIGGSNSDNGLYKACAKLNPNSTINIGSDLTNEKTVARYNAQKAKHVINLLSNLLKRREEKENIDHQNFLDSFKRL